MFQISRSNRKITDAAKYNVASHDFGRAVSASSTFVSEMCVTPSPPSRLLNEASRPVRESAEGLSSREEIIAQVSKGLTNKEIARALNLRQKTVKRCMIHIMQKLRVGNRYEAALLGQERQRAFKSFSPLEAAAPFASERSA